jgi:hypothetical protein
MNAKPNPFLLTKSNDLTDDQIEELWIEFSTEGKGGAFFSPSSPMPTIILGGKGSGKTHLMRYYSFDIQRIRFERNGDVEAGLKADGYIGIYTRAGGLNAERFHDKYVTEEQWKDVFAYYMELWFAQEVIAVLIRLLPAIQDLRFKESIISKAALRLFDIADFDNIDNLRALEEMIESLQKELDTDINNAAFKRAINPTIRCSRGALIFGIPKILTQEVPVFDGLTFAYQVDEFENFTTAQQMYINTLVRERVHPVTFRIGARAYGMRTYLTLSAGEDLKEGSEYECLRLDQRFRASEKAYKEFSKAMIARRIQHVTGIESFRPESLEDFFEMPDNDWRSPIYLEMVNSSTAKERSYFSTLTSKLRASLKRGRLPGLSDDKSIDEVVDLLVCQNYPLLEKVNVYLFYQAWSRGEDLYSAARSIQQMNKDFLKGTNDRKYDQTLSHYKNDFIAQLRRESNENIVQVYTGLDTFIVMSEGLPRALITLLKHVYSWASFYGEVPFEIGKMSLKSQYRGVADASEWFLEDMRKAGQDGVHIRTAIDRLGELFRLNHFADKPIECSLIAFSVDQDQMTEAARTTLNDAKNRSFLVEISGGQKERNSRKVTAKYQLHRMISPHFELPVARRGVIPLSTAEANAVFDYDRAQEFKTMISNWRKRLIAPFTLGTEDTPSLFD